MQENVIKDSYEDNLGTSPSALRDLSTLGADMRKRDSGYGTDFSPASITSTSRKFTYDEFDLSDAIREFEIQDDDDDAFGPERMLTPSPEEDETDREVQELCAERGDHSVSEPVSIQRPSAPLPTPEGYEGDGPEEPEDDRHISVPFHHSLWTENDTPMQGFEFRPIVSRRSIGTQTPSPHRTYNTPFARFQPYNSQLLQRGTARRLRFPSESNDSNNGTLGPLPDIVPLSRDRSASLPEMQAYRGGRHEQEVGRELRRLSDEFISSFKRVSRRRTLSEHASSFPTMCWNSIRQMWNSSPLGRTNIPRIGSPVDPEYYNQKPPSTYH